MTQQDKERIEKYAKRYLLQTYGGNYPDAEKAYIAGATAEHERMSEQVKESYKTGWRDGYDDFKNNDLKEQLKQERNKGIDECIALFKDEFWLTEGTDTEDLIKRLESLKH